MSKVRRKTSPIVQKLLNRIPKEEFDLTSKRLLLSQKINNALKRNGLSKSDFADKMGVKPSNVSRWLKGDHNYTSDTLFKMEAILNESFVDLGERKEETKLVVQKKRFDEDVEIEKHFQYDSFTFVNFPGSALVANSKTSKHQELVM